MANRDMNARRKPFLVLTPATVTTSVNTTVVDLGGPEGLPADGCAFEFCVTGAVGDTLAAGSKTFEFNMQESSDNFTTSNYVSDLEITVPHTQSTSGKGLLSTTTNTGGAVNPGAFFMATANSQLVSGTWIRVSYVGKQRYVRCRINATGTTNGTPFLCVAQVGYPHNPPVQGNGS